MRTSERFAATRIVVETAGSTSSVPMVEVADSPALTQGQWQTLIAISVLAVGVRLMFINQPYVDHWSWRQSDVAAIARNFFHNGFRFGFPQIDWAGSAAGYVGTEFPMLPFIAALCYKFAGVQDWIGRIQPVIFFAVSLPFFFLLVRKVFGTAASLWASFFYSFAPLDIFAGRSFMPDVPSLSLAIIGLYFVVQWADTGECSRLFSAASAISLSLLIKITSVVILAPVLYIVLAKRADLGWRGRSHTEQTRGRRPRLHYALFAAIALLPSIGWYWHAYEIAREFHPHHFFGAGGVRTESFSWYWRITEQTLTSSMTPLLSMLGLLGICVPWARDQKYSRVFGWWLAAMIVFIVIVGYGNRHPWYQLPLVPIFAAFAGAGCAFVASKISSPVIAAGLSILLVISFAILAFWYVGPLYEPAAAQLRDAGLQLKKLTPADALIVAADMGDPTIFYYAERKGWHFLERDATYNGTPEDSEHAIENLEQLRHDGATHFVLIRNTLWWIWAYPDFIHHLGDNATLIEATPEFRIYSLNPLASKTH
jgi:4-amino-4-deoxy-L-arabinose transferase-like glycosyltransferase